MTPDADNQSLPKRPTHLDRTQILDATEASLNQLGYDGTTIRQIAKRLNCAVGSIYRYFKDKRSLLDAVTQRRLLPIIQLLEQGASVEESLELYVQIARSKPQQYRLMFWLAIASSSSTDECPDFADGVPAVPLVILQLIEAWSSRLGSAEEAQQLWALVHGQLMLGDAWITGEDADQGKDQSKLVVLVDAAGNKKTSGLAVSTDSKSG